MQPYFFPYIGYFQLINAVDTFIIYDNIQYTKKGWINRNRILVNGKDEYITLPLKKDSDYLNIKDRELSDVFEKDKFLRKLRERYRKAPEFQNVFPIIEEVINFEEKNLFYYIYNSLRQISVFLDIKTKFIISSSLEINHDLKSEEKVIELCKKKNTSQYINPIGGLELYSKDIFNKQAIELTFLKSDTITYNQFNHEFIPWLSIIDVLMFNSKPIIKDYLNKYTLL